MDLQRACDKLQRFRDVMSDEVVHGRRFKVDPREGRHVGYLLNFVSITRLEHLRVQTLDVLRKVQNLRGVNEGVVIRNP